jgi:transcriptional regulator with XRE-family HTH domain
LKNFEKEANMSVATRIKNRRIDLGATQTQLAKRARLTPAAISQFESGARKPSFDALSQLAEALRVTTDYLLGKKELGYEDILADPRVSVMFRGMMELSESDKEAMLEFYEFLKSRKEKNGKWGE